MIKARWKNHFPFQKMGTPHAKLLDGTECQLLLDTDANKLFMSKSFYM